MFSFLTLEISLKRPQGKWHPLFHIISMIAIPLIYSAYVGIAEAARDLAVEAGSQAPGGWTRGLSSLVVSRTS